MKNFKIIGWLFGLLFVLMCAGETKANCPDCEAHSPNSHFCIKDGFIYEENKCDTPFRFVGVNVRALARMSEGDQNRVFDEAKAMGATVIRFNAANSELTNDVAATKVKELLQRAQGEVPEMKFIITLASFHGNRDYYRDEAPNTNKNGVIYYPKWDNLTDSPYQPTANGLQILGKEWFNLRGTPGSITENRASYEKLYKPWVSELLAQLNNHKSQILSIELCHDLKNIDTNRIEGKAALQIFINNMTKLIKDAVPILVSVGNTSTYHMLNNTKYDDPENRTTNNDDFRDAIYWKPGTNADKSNKVDFITNHHYNNEWSCNNREFNGYLHQDEDIKYAIDNNIPWIVEELGFSGNEQEYGVFEGGCWKPVDTNQGLMLPSTGTGTSRACAVNRVIGKYYFEGITGAMASGFCPFETDIGIGGKSAELDRVYADDYYAQIEAWKSKALLITGDFYECKENMNITNTPPVSVAICSGRQVTASAVLNPDISMHMVGEEFVDIVEGFDTNNSPDVSADIQEVACLKCETFNTCEVEASIVETEKASYWRCRAYEEADLYDWDVDKGLEHNKYNNVNAWNYYGTLYAGSPYLNDNEHQKRFQWAGMAKLTSDELYSGFQDVHVLGRAFRDNGTDYNKLITLMKAVFHSDNQAVNTAIELALNRLSVDHFESIVDELWSIERTFMSMQQQIFDDIAWQHLAYKHGKLNNDPGLVQRILNDDENLIHSRDRRNALIGVWNDIDSNDWSRIKRGNRNLLWHEQYHVIQDDWETIWNQSAFGKIFSYILSLKSTNPIECGEMIEDTQVAPYFEVSNTCGRNFREAVMTTGTDIIPFDVSIEVPTSLPIPIVEISAKIVNDGDDRWSWIEPEMLNIYLKNVEDHPNKVYTAVMRTIEVDNKEARFVPEIQLNTNNFPHIFPSYYEANPFSIDINLNLLFPLPPLKEYRVRDNNTCGRCPAPGSLKQQTPLENDQYQFTIQPNPFNTQTEIVFNLTEDAPVTIRVTDMMGKHIVTLADHETRTAGQHTVIFDGISYPAGMYMTHIQVGEYSGTQKMILAK